MISDSIDSDLSDYCKKIRALTYDTRPIIVALSKSDDIVDKLDVLRSGADDFISEPVNPEEFVMRIKAHLRREYESNLDIKKSLPNRNYSMRALKRMISAKDARAALLISIDNFLNYKENYTELASDKLIQTYWAIIKSTIEEEDFFGEIKENEFLVITDRDKAEAVANYLIYAFETVSSKFYSIEDNKRGYMMMKGDSQAGRRSNFVHTTIGVITGEFLQYKDSSQLFNALVQIHKLAKRVLISEKDEALTILLKTILDLQGYDVMVMPETEQIFSVNEPPALIILDAGEIETLEGIAHCKNIKNDVRFAGSKIILTSILHDKEMVLNCGADLYLPKPYELSTLIKWVDTLLKE